MSASKRLSVWLHGRHIAWLTGTSLRPKLEYLPDVVAEYGSGAALLSLSLPLRRGALTGPEVYNFFDGLLPEGQVRAQIAAQSRTPVTDIKGLLAAVGADCAGAVQVLPEGVDPVGQGELLEMSDAEVVAVVESLPTWDLPDDFAITASLGGVQSKVLLTKYGDQWCWPAGGAASTHIIKPDPLDSPIPHLLASEDWALRLASSIGLRAARAELELFGSRLSLVVQRYDRGTTGERIHQEDFTQLLGLPAAAKYDQSTGLPSRLARVVERVGPHSKDASAFRVELLKTVTFNLLIGNGDAHSKNYSILIQENGEVSLAPLYDAAPTLLLYSRSSNAGHAIAGQARLNYLTADHLVREAASWGLDPEEGRVVVEETLQRAIAADVGASEEISKLPELVAARASDLLAGRAARQA